MHRFTLGPLIILFWLLAGSSVETLAQTNPNIVVQWDDAALQGVRDSKIGPPMVARALAMIHTCVYDAWAAYDVRAKGTQLGGTLRRPVSERTLANKQKAMSFAAYRAAIDLFPGDKSRVFDPLMASLGYDPNDVTIDVRTPSGVGNVACAAVLEFRHRDGSNQLGDLTPSGVPYADYTGYKALNPPTTVPANPALLLNPDHWQPLQYVDATGTFVRQGFVAAQWYKVKPYAMSSPSQFRSFIARFGPALHGSAAFVEQAQELIDFSAHLTDTQKMIAEYWKDGPKSETPPGHWCLFAQFVSDRDHHTLDDDAKMFYAMTNAVFDAGIAAWDAKRAFDSVRPVSALPFLFQGKTISAWGGPFRGTVQMNGSDWIPYQPADFPTPPFPEYISGHSTFSAAGATILALWTRSDRFGGSVTFPEGSSTIEPGAVPAAPVTLSWETFSEAADEAGISRRYGGIHFKRADLVGRAVGRIVAVQVWQKASDLFRGN
jgi:hypothetical protein